MTPRHYLTLILLLTMSLWLTPVHSAQFRVALPNGELRASVTDLRVKVRGGQVSLERTWSNGRWYLNPAWADLKFRFNSEDGSVRYVDRAGAVYEKLGMTSPSPAPRPPSPTKPWSESMRCSTSKRIAPRPT